MANNPLAILTGASTQTKSPPLPPSSGGPKGVNITIRLQDGSGASQTLFDTSQPSSMASAGSNTLFNTSEPASFASAGSGGYLCNTVPPVLRSPRRSVPAAANEKSLLNIPISRHPMKERSYAEPNNSSIKAQSFSFPNASALYPTPPPVTPPPPPRPRPARAMAMNTTYASKPRIQSTFSQKTLPDGTFVKSGAMRADQTFAKVSDGTFVRPPAAASGTFVRPPAAASGTFVRPPTVDEQTYVRPPGIANPRSYSRHPSDDWLYDNSGDYADYEAQDPFFNSTVSSHGSYLMGSPEYQKFKPDVQSSPNKQHAYMLDGTLKSLAALDQHERTQVIEKLGEFQRKRRQIISSKSNRTI